MPGDRKQYRAYPGRLQYGLGLGAHRVSPCFIKHADAHSPVEDIVDMAGAFVVDRLAQLGLDIGQASDEPISQSLLQHRLRPVAVGLPEVLDDIVRKLFSANEPISAIVTKVTKYEGALTTSGLADIKSFWCVPVVIEPDTLTFVGCHEFPNLRFSSTIYAISSLCRHTGRHSSNGLVLTQYGS